PGQAACPFLEVIEMAGGIAASRHGPDRGPGDDVELQPCLEQGAQHANMRKAAGSAAAQRQPQCWAGWAHERCLADRGLFDRYVGGRLGHVRRRGDWLRRRCAAIRRQAIAVTRTPGKEVKHTQYSSLRRMIRQISRPDNRLLPSVKKPNDYGGTAART